MFGSLSFKAVRQKQNNAAHAQPLRLARRQKLINDHLRAVGEVAELRLPQDEGVGVGEGVAVLVAEDAEFAERRIHDFNVAGVRRDVLEGPPLALGVLINEGGVTLREGAAVAVLSAHADGMPLRRQTREGEGLAGRPVDRLAGLYRRAALGEKLLYFRMRREVRRRRHERGAEALEFVNGDGGVAAMRLPLAHRLDAAPHALKPVRLVGTITGRGFKFVGETLALAFAHGADRLAVNVAAFDEMLGVNLGREGTAANLAVHPRLREGRLVHFVVTEAAVAEKVKHDVAVESLTIFRREARHDRDRFGILAVDMKNRRLRGFREVGAVRTRASVDRIGREADLIVDDEMNRAADAVSGEVGEIQGFGDHALSGEGGVSVEQQRQDAGAVVVAELALFRARLAEDERVDRLKVRGVRRQREMNAPSGEGAVGGGAEVILHIAGAALKFGFGRLAAELGEDGGEGFIHDIGEDIEASAVRHAEDDLFHSAERGVSENLFQGGDGGFGAVESEAFCAGEAFSEEAFKFFGGDESFQDVFAFAGVGREGCAVFHFCGEPVALDRVLDVHEFGADGSAVDGVECGEDVFEGCPVLSEDAAEVDVAFEVFVFEAVCGGVEVGVGDAAGESEGVEAGFEVSADAVVADEEGDAQRVAGFASRGAGGFAAGFSVCERTVEGREP